MSCSSVSYFPPCAFTGELRMEMYVVYVFSEFLGPSNRICLLLANWSVHKIEIQENPDSAPVIPKPDPVAEIERLKLQDCKIEIQPLRTLDWTSIPEKYR